MEKIPRVLIIDDNEALCRSLQQLCKRQEMEADYATSLSHGVEAAQFGDYDIIFLDVNLPEGSGIDFIPKLRETGSSPEIIIITGYGDEAGAELAIRSGAWDYIQKSTSSQNIKLSLTRALQYREQKKKKKSQVVLKRDAIVGGSRRIVNCLNLVAQAAGNGHPVIISGETGTGKELFARAIYENSMEGSDGFVIVDCAALPEHLVESTLFGHKKGAFTGAEKDQEGLIKQADGGTLFLDEIGELPLSIQAKFLRVLQEKRFRPVGGKKEVTSNFRLISATNRNLPEMIEKGQFRKDLYYRIQTIRINLPPLRDRLEDIPALVLSRINRSCTLLGERSHDLSPDFIDTLMAYEWPGNVRELFNIIDRALSEAFDEPVLFPRHLPTHIRTNATLKKLALTGSNFETDCNGTKGLVPLKTYVEEMKITYLKNLIVLTQGDIQKACRLSGLSRAYLYQLLKKYNIGAQLHQDNGGV